MQKYQIKTGKAAAVKPLLLIGAGLLTGLLSGFFGGGGGMLVVPCLAAIMNISEKQAHATAISVILPLTVISGIVYVLRGVPVGDGATSVIISVVIGGAIGAMLLSKLSNGAVSAVFYILMIVAGIKMLL